jgi:hypothetical protein
MLFNALLLHTGRIKYIASGREHFSCSKQHGEEMRAKKIISRKTILKLKFDKQGISWLRVKELDVPSI